MFKHVELVKFQTKWRRYLGSHCSVYAPFEISPRRQRKKGKVWATKGNICLSSRFPFSASLSLLLLYWEEESVTLKLEPLFLLFTTLNLCPDYPFSCYSTLKGAIFPERRELSCPKCKMPKSTLRVCPNQ